MRVHSTILVVVLVATAAFVPAAVIAEPATGTPESTTGLSQPATGTSETTTDLSQPVTDVPTTGTFDDHLDCEYEQTLEDVTGTAVTIEGGPESIVAVQPSDTQLLLEIGADDAMVGAPIGPFTDHLDVPDDVTDISEDDGATPVAESIIDLDADVVIAANTVLSIDGFVDQLRDADQTVYVYDVATSIEEVEENVELAGVLANECDGASETIDEMTERLDVVDEVVEGQERPLGFYLSGPDDLFTPGADTFQHDILERGGLENVAERAGIVGWEEISEEVVIDEDPEWIVYGDVLAEPPEMDATTGTSAWDDGQFVVVDSNAMSQPGPHIVDAVEEIAATVHPDRYEEVTGEDTGDDRSTSDDDAEADDGGADDTADDEAIPGFAIVPAIAALLVAALIVGLAMGRTDPDSTSP